MSSNKKKNILIYLSKAILIALLIVFVVRSFIVESYTISSTQMETALLKGDEVLVNKTAYGIRLPMTIFSVPFVFDDLFGLKSYSTALEAPYCRIFDTYLKPNDIILFNNPLESEKPIDKRALLVSRCVALPGDTLEMKNGVLFINNMSYILSPDVVNEYIFNISIQKDIEEVLQEQNISIRNYKLSGDTASIELNKYEAFIVNQNLRDSLNIAVSGVHYNESYKMAVPAKGMEIDLTAFNLSAYKQTILQEQGSKARFNNDKLIIDGKEQARYIFEDDYYWMLSDNSSHSIDSRSLGFIPFSHVIGEVTYVWYHSDNANISEDRRFSAVK
ncbi:signal peptidase I [Dysgonomonas sp. ZJ709]|uniref:signal peptidase I n=1 Tax=Dysgonomonas sp. ZJ709 TaxID=2709797 RepID=UPI0013EB8EE9|nr:signal peptidase I [Dysgonomonas sp. ZJ709]